MATAYADIANAEQLLRVCGIDANTVARLDQIRDDLNNTPIRVAVVGAFKAGKTTLCNALLGVNLLPSQAAPNTAAIGEVQRGVERYALETASGAKSIDRQAFIEEVQRETPKGASPTTVRAWLPTTLLAEGVTLADTPGVGSFEDVHAEVTYGYLPRVDAIVLVVDAEKGGLQSGDITFIRDRLLQRTRERLWVVVNRLNLKPESEHAAILGEIANTLRDSTGVSNPRIFAVNALAAAAARTSGAGATGTGIEELERALTQEVYAQIRELRDSRARTQLGAVLGDAAANLRVQAGALAFDATAIDGQLRQLRSERDRLHERVSTAEADLHSEQQRMLSEVESRIRSAVATVANRAGQYLADVEARGVKDQELVLGNMIQGDLMRALEALIRDWLEPELTGRLKQFSDNINVAASALKQAMPTVDLSGVKTGPNPYLVAGVEIALNVLLNWVLPGEWLIALLGRVVGKRVFDPIVKEAVSWISQLAAGFVKGRVAKEIADQINKLGPDIAAEVKVQVQQVFSRAKVGVRADLDRRVGEIEAALEAARRLREQGVANVATERDQLLRKVQDLEAFAHGLVGANNG